MRGQIQREGEVIHIVAHELFDRTHDLDALSDDEFELSFANADHVKSPLPEVTSMKRKVERLEARGETAENDIAKMRPTPSNANIIPLARADEVKNPQEDHRAEKEKQKPRPIIVNQGRHPRNVRIIPKSRDFH